MKCRVSSGSVFERMIVTGMDCRPTACLMKLLSQDKLQSNLSGSFLVLCVPVGLQGQRREIRDDVVEHPYGSGEARVVVFLLEPVFGDAFGDGGVDEGVVADEDAYMADAVAAGLEKYQIAGLELAAFDFLPDTCHFDGGAGQFRTEHPVVHEPHETGAVEPFRALPPEAVPDAEKLFHIAEKVLHRAGRFFRSGLQRRISGRGIGKSIGGGRKSEYGQEESKNRQETAIS